MRASRKQIRGLSTLAKSEGETARAENGDAVCEVAGGKLVGNTGVIFISLDMDTPGTVVSMATSTTATALASGGVLLHGLKDGTGNTVVLLEFKLADTVSNSTGFNAEPVVRRGGVFHRPGEIAKVGSMETEDANGDFVSSGLDVPSAAPGVAVGRTPASPS